MPQISEIDRAFIKWEVAGEQVLMILLSRNGTLNRMGDGEQAKKHPMYLGNTEEPLLEQWLAELDPGWLEEAGRYEMPDPEGDICVLTIALEGEGLDLGFAFRYGSDSMGPPEEMVHLLELALDLTDPWYEEQLSRRRRN
jgi:hypothetical protein